MDLYDRPKATTPALLTAIDSTLHVHLIVGANALAGARCARSIEVGAKPILLAPADASLPYNLVQRIELGKVQWLTRDFEDADLSELGREAVNHVVDAVFVTLNSRDPLCSHISQLCKRLRIPVNVVDSPSLSTFTLLSTHTSGPLQIGVTTSGRGCHLSSRIRREIASSLPANLGQAVDKLGRLRRRIQDEDSITLDHGCTGDEDTGQDSSFNKLVTPEDADAAKTRRMRWLAQICEYWPLRRLAEITDADVDAVLRAYIATGTGNGRSVTQMNGHLVPQLNGGQQSRTAKHPGPQTNGLSGSRAVENSSSQASGNPNALTNGHSTSRTDGHAASPANERLEAQTDERPHENLFANISHLTSPPPPPPLPPPSKGTIILAGSGPGHPSLLTIATLRAIQSADLILADKLVPAPVLDLIPRRAEVKIARKFPGNADAAQDELLSLGLDGLKAGKTVLRLKQGDPFLYGRGAEEVFWFRNKGHEAVVIPGVTSSLSGPLFAGIPVTHRGVSDGVLICTGTGRHGQPPDAPSYVRSRTVVWLMALHRVRALVAELTEAPSDTETCDAGVVRPNFTAWPADTPCAVIERASCSDQRVIRTTLRHVVAAVEELGSRPPGLLVVGHACKVLHSPEDKTPWLVEEGLGEYGRWAHEGVDVALGAASSAGLNSAKAAEGLVTTDSKDNG